MTGAMAVAPRPGAFGGERSDLARQPCGSCCRPVFAQVIMAGNNKELACVYAALILHDEGLEISADKISALLKAANVEVEAYWPTLFAKLCKGKDMDTLISSVGSASSGGGGGGGGGAAPAAEKAKEPEPEEEEEEMGFDLFD